MKKYYKSIGLHFHFQLIILFTINSSLYSQPFAIGHTTITFVDASRSNRSVATEIYYPSNTAGNNVPVTTLNTDKFPALTFGHGFVMTYDAYQNIWESIVPQGFIMAFPKTEGSFSPSHLEYAKDLAFVIDQMNNLGLLNTSIFYNRVSIMNAVMGHSMGGGAAFLATQLNTNIKSIVTLAAAETNPSAVQAAGLSAIPALVVAGANDCVTAPSTNQLLMYNALTSSCKTYISIIGGSHCQMANNNFFCNTGESSCTPTPTITRTFQQTVVSDYLIKWLNAQLKTDCVAGADFNTLISSDTRITFLKNCLQCTSLSIDEVFNDLFKVFPNPFNNQIIVNSTIYENQEIYIYDSASKKLIQQKIEENCSINTEALPLGTYLYQIKLADKVLKSGLLLKN